MTSEDWRKIRNRIVAQRAVEAGVDRKEAVANKTVYPSGSDRAAYSLPMLVPAPPLFSMKTC